MATAFSLAYIFALPYIMLSVYFLASSPASIASWLFALPFLISAATPPVANPRIVGALSPMLAYFKYKEIHEWTEDEALEAFAAGRKYILAAVPHGVVSYVGFCSSVATREEFRIVPTAVAGAILKIPVLKHVLGIWCLIDASAPNLKRHLRRETAGPEGSVVIYVGGMAELFLSSPDEERLYLSKRKGFIKLALREGADVVPLYLFGNTSVLSVLRRGPLAALSRRTGMSLTFFWGRWGTPVPRNHNILFVRGRPLGMPHLPEPTDADVEEWHAKYCDEVRRIYEKYSEKMPMYRNKKLYIE